jgi:methylglyoxal synthase
MAPKPSPPRSIVAAYGELMRRVALIAHDGKKQEMLELVRSHLDVLVECELIATGSTGTLVSEALGVPVRRVSSGPYGGDLQVGARVVEGELDLVIFLRDPLAAHPHEPDIQALMKVCDLHEVPLATNTATAALCLEAAFKIASPA